MKRPPREHIEIILIGHRKFEVSQKKAKAVLVLLENEHETVPASEVFKEEIAKYTKPGLALRGARQKEELSQVELAEKLGIAQTDLSKMEYGKRSIGKTMAKRLSKILNIDYRVFL